MTGQEPSTPSFDGDVVLVGGAETPVGREFIEYLRARGATVYRADAHRDGRSAVEEVVATAGRLDAVVLCTAPPGLDGIDAGDEPTGRDVRELCATWDLAAAAARHLAATGSGRVVVVLPGHGVFGAPAATHRMVLLGALTGLVRSLAIEATDTGVHVNAVAPVLAADLPDGFFRRYPHLDAGRYTPASVIPAIGALAHRGCRLRGAVLSATGGRVSRVALVTGIGVPADEPQLSELVGSDARGPALTGPFEPSTTVEELLLVEV